MARLGKWAIVAGAAAMLAMPGTAGAGASEDEALRRLDIMLMVTALRCRTGADDFRREYGAFTAAHMTTLNGAARRMEGGLVARHGAKGAKRALDTLSVGMANQYGQGHPWLGCAELKGVAGELAATRDPAALAAAARELLGSAPQSSTRWARR